MRKARHTARRVTGCIRIRWKKQGNYSEPHLDSAYAASRCGFSPYEIPEKIYMDGKQVYRFGTTKPIENINELLRKSNLTLKDIKYIVPHQSNLKMLKRICKELNIEEQKMYINIQNVGNTFCASIPIALTEMFEKDLLKSGDKIILIGYGGGVNLGSILLEI